MKLPNLVHNPVAGFVLGGLALGLTFYFLGNQPGIKQAAMGLNGAVSPNAPKAIA